MNKETALFLDKTVGQVLDIDTGPSGDCLGEYLHVHIEVDVTKPLERSFEVELGSEECMVFFKYKPLPHYCYDCGMLSHTNKECPQEKASHDYNPEPKAKYADWLKVPVPTRSKRNLDQELSSPLHPKATHIE